MRRWPVVAWPRWLDWFRRLTLPGDVLRLTRAFQALPLSLAALPWRMVRALGRHFRHLGLRGVALRMLVLFISVGSGTAGYLIGQSAHYAPQRERWISVDAVWRQANAAESTSESPALGALRPDGDVGAIDGNAALRTTAVSAALDERIGRLRAELIELSVLFKRLVEHVGLDEEEFEIQDEPLTQRYSKPSDSIDLLNRSVAHMKVSGRQLARVLGERDSDERLSISGKPVSKVDVSSGYGVRMHPVYGSRRMHHGIDYRGRPGDPIFAVADGIVTYSGRNGSYGNLVELEHSDGYLTRYAHNQSNAVDVGELVHKGETIARIGSTGRATGPHLHFEVRNRDGAVDPLVFVR